MESIMAEGGVGGGSRGRGGAGWKRYSSKVKRGIAIDKAAYVEDGGY